MTKHSKEQRLERVNLILGRDESAWLDQLGAEILEQTGAKVSRSEIVRAGIATLAELHRLAPSCPEMFTPLALCKSGSELAVLGVLAMRCATVKP
jgi:hypothetical protein